MLPWHVRGIFTVVGVLFRPVFTLCLLDSTQTARREESCADRWVTHKHFGCTAIENTQHLLCLCDFSWWLGILEWTEKVIRFDSWQASWVLQTTRRNDLWFKAQEEQKENASLDDASLGSCKTLHFQAKHDFKIPSFCQGVAAIWEEYCFQYTHQGGATKWKRPG